MKSIAACCYIVFVVSSPAHAVGGNKNHLKAAVESSKLCEPLKFDAKKVFELFGVKVPDVLSAVVDTNVGWDKTIADVKRFSVSGGRLEIQLKLMCTPSEEGEVIKALKINPKDVAIREDITCKGSVKDGKVDGDLSCDTGGDIGKALARAGIVKDRLKPIIDAALAAK